MIFARRSSAFSWLARLADARPLGSAPGAPAGDSERLFIDDLEVAPVGAAWVRDEARVAHRLLGEARHVGPLHAAARQRPLHAQLDAEAVDGRQDGAHPLRGRHASEIEAHGEAHLLVAVAGALEVERRHVPEQERIALPVWQIEVAT